MGDSASRCAHLDLKFTLWLGKQERKVKKMGIKEYGRSLLESVRTQGTKCSGTLLIYLNMARTVCGLGLAVPSGSDKEWIKLPAYLGLWIIRLIRWCLAICRLTGKVVAYVFQE